MTMILVDGFDLVDGIDVWTSFVATHVTDIKRTGTHSAGQIGAGGPAVYRALSASQEDDGVTMGIAAYQSASNAIGGLGGVTGAMIVLMENTTVHLSAMFRNDTRTLEIWRGTWNGGTRLAFTDTNIWTHDTWHYLELGAKIHDTTGSYDVRLNGVTVLAATNVDTRNGGTSGIVNRMGFRGNEDSGSAQLIRFDDPYLLNEQGAIRNTFLGDTRSYPLYPMGNGFYAMLVGSDANSVDNYLLVDEAGTPVSADYVGSVTAGDKDSYLLQDLSSFQTVGTIHALETRLYAAKSETGTKQMRPVLRQGGADQVGADHILAWNSYATYRDIFQLNPATAANWTIVEVDALEVGAEVRA